MRSYSSTHYDPEYNRPSTPDEQATAAWLLEAARQEMEAERPAADEHSESVIDDEIDEKEIDEKVDAVPGPRFTAVTGGRFWSRLGGGPKDDSATRNLCDSLDDLSDGLRSILRDELKRDSET